MKKLLYYFISYCFISQNQFLDSILQVRDQRIDEVFNRNIMHGDLLKNRIDSIIGLQEPISGYNYILKVANMEGFEKDAVLIQKII